MNWEHWSIYLFYIPILPYAFYESFKSRHLCFFYSTNPGIFHSGNGTESKYETVKLIPENYRPETIFFSKRTSWEDVKNSLFKSNIRYPLIAKPDKGYRGYLVKLIKDEVALKSYISKFNELDLILQEFISYKNECGIFYTKKPSEDKGNITSVTLKKFLFVEGDGVSTLEELIVNHERASIYFDLIKNIHESRFDDVLPKGKEMQLSVIGNHSKGTEFLNGNHFIDTRFIRSVDRVCKQINGFNYGRLDVKYETIEALKKGHFKILEINGIMAEPTHVFDTTSPKSTYKNALKEQIKHWGLLAEIAREHHILNNVPYHPFSSFIKDLFWMKRYSKKLKMLNKL